MTRSARLATFGNFSCHSLLVTRHGFGGVLIFPGDKENQCHAGADGGVGNVERWKTDFIAAALLEIETEEIHYFMPPGQQAVSEIARDAAENQAEGNLAGQRVRINMMPREKQRDEREEGDDGERDIVSAEEAPSRARVAPVHELKKAFDDNFLVVGRERFQHQPLGELIQHKHDQRERGDAPVRFLKNALRVGLGHLWTFI